MSFKSSSIIFHLTVGYCYVCVCVQIWCNTREKVMQNYRFILFIFLLKEELFGLYHKDYIYIVPFSFGRMVESLLLTISLDYCKHNY